MKYMMFTHVLSCNPTALSISSEITTCLIKDAMLILSSLSCDILISRRNGMER